MAARRDLCGFLEASCYEVAATPVRPSKPKIQIHVRVESPARRQDRSTANLAVPGSGAGVAAARKARCAQIGRQRHGAKSKLRAEPGLPNPLEEHLAHLLSVRVVKVHDVHHRSTAG